MAVILQPSSLWSQISNLFFLLSGVFNDLLVLRVTLVFAYVFLLVQALLGFPSWSNSFAPWSGNIGLDTVIWCTINVFLHGCGVARMYYDERHIPLTEEQEALWRYVYRHSGLSKAQFKSLIAPELKLQMFERGEAIPTADHFYVIFDGIVGAHVKHLGSGVKREIRMFSGEMFPLEHLYIDYVPQESVFTRSRLRPVAETKVRVYSLPVSVMKSLSNNPDARDSWYVSVCVCVCGGGGGGRLFLMAIESLVWW
jgi:hypothetical protein